MSGVIGLDQQVKSGLFGFPSGHIIQIVHDELPAGLVSTSQATIGSSSMSITLSSASHYVYIIISGGSYRDGGGAAHHQYLTLNGGGFGTGYNSNSSTTDSLLQAACNYQFNHLARDFWSHSRLDTNPGGTSVTYSLHGHPQNDGGGTVTIRYTDVNYTLMEIRP